MATKYSFGENHIAHFVTCTVVNWIDIFSREDYKNIVLDSLQYCIQKKGLIVHVWVIMSNHIHLIISTKAENKLADIIRDFKKYTAQQIIKAIEEHPKESRKEWILWLLKRAGARNPNNDKYQFWIQDNHPIGLITSEMLKQGLNYLHENPVRAGWVLEAQHYKYSSAIDYYCETKGMLQIEHL
jgi:REP element-mobilizing transposase RayT